MTLLGDLEAFYQQHGRCGELDSELTDGEPGWVIMTCTCGAKIARRIGGRQSLDRWVFWCRLPRRHGVLDRRSGDDTNGSRNGRH